ncbi:hypothetical protein TNCV_985801 [Trichonephila clavipes]|uniref:Uncharacterized protein n=1 Tax=Trichonephila clavipes TaxID=2585209 RepID=A0A8X6VMM3_TRICX|nr:hypothetical protein TNCV_985801 [Trichonephila clavipes]
MHGFLQLFPCNVHLAVTKEKKYRQTRAFSLYCYHHLEITGSLCKTKSRIQPRVPKEAVERMRQIFVRSLQKSTRFATYKLEMP